MSLISEQLWQSCIGDIPMPKDCTYWQFVAARDALWQEEDQEWSVAYIKQLKHLKSLPNMLNQAEELDELITAELERLSK